jgi:hypothetical protein
METITRVLVGQLDIALLTMQELLKSSPGSLAEPSDWEEWGKRWLAKKVIDSFGTFRHRY